jgi:hypothetical protein
VFANFASQHAQIGASHIYRVQAAPAGADHVWAVMTTQTLTLGNTYSLNAMGVTGIILDGWTEDWWFPNVGPFDTLHLNCWRMGSPFALAIRAKIQVSWDTFRVNEQCC